MRSEGIRSRAGQCAKMVFQPFFAPQASVTRAPSSEASTRSSRARTVDAYASAIYIPIEEVRRPRALEDELESIDRVKTHQNFRVYPDRGSIVPDTRLR